MKFLKIALCDIFGHKMIQIKDDERKCLRCKNCEKRLKTQDGFKINYSNWKSASFVDSIATVGNKVRLAFMAPGTSYWVVIESTLDKITFQHPVTNDVITTSQDPSVYQILN